MEKRKANIMFNKSGAGSRTTRITLPVPWVDILGATQEDREVFLYQIGNQIIISKEEIKMDVKKAVDLVKKEIENEMETTMFIDDSDNIERFIDKTIKEVIVALSSNYEEEEENKDLYFDDILDEIGTYMKETYKKVGENINGEHVGYYYNNSLNFENIAQLENYFKIGE